STTRRKVLTMLRSLVAREPDEDFRWVARLDDGRDYSEIGPDGTARGWANVPHERVVAIGLIPQRDDLHGFALPIASGQRPVVFRRRQITVSGVTGDEIARRSITVIGWESADETRYLAVYPNGDSRSTTDKAAIQ